MNINVLVNKASKLGASGLEVLGWIPPQTATEDPAGKFIVAIGEQENSATEFNWYEK